jgi:threonylcarbamoyladenosine tRNA methylthiotransferase MtaB
MKIAFYTLGCKVNQYETGVLSEKFRMLGFDVVAPHEFADVYVINSCTVTSVADKKSRNYLRRSKKKNPDSITALIGCYAQIAGDQIKTEVPEIDLVLGSEEKSELPQRILSMLSPEDVHLVHGTGVSTVASRTRSYIKIEDGCDRFCSYCVIPYARGKVTSRYLDEIINEANSLVHGGCKEIILTGINAALYGRDRGESEGIASVIEGISRIDGDFRIKLSSLEPTVIDADYAAKLVKYEKLCPHMHLSLQSGSDGILEKMQRNYRMDDYMRIVEVLKKHDPDYSISTDIIVGFPGETEADFRKSVEAVRNIGFSNVHVFKYSKRPLTTAVNMPEQVSDETKNERSRILLKESEMAAKKFRENNAGKMKRVLFLGAVEEPTEVRESVYEGVTENELTVFMKSEADLTNSFRSVTI